MVIADIMLDFALNSRGVNFCAGFPHFIGVLSTIVDNRRQPFPFDKIHNIS